MIMHHKTLDNFSKKEFIRLLFSEATSEAHRLHVFSFVKAGVQCSAQCIALRPQLLRIDDRPKTTKKTKKAEQNRAN